MGGTSTMMKLGLLMAALGVVAIVVELAFRW